jgi:magnesium-transporting ATPase (P-type)
MTLRVAYIIAIEVEGYFRAEDPETPSEARQLAFMALTLCQIFHIFAVRTHSFIISREFYNNRWLLIGVGVAIGFLILGCYVPGLNDILNQTPMTGEGERVSSFLLLLLLLLSSSLIPLLFFFSSLFFSSLFFSSPSSSHSFPSSSFYLDWGKALLCVVIHLSVMEIFKAIYRRIQMRHAYKFLP